MSFPSVESMSFAAGPPQSTVPASVTSQQGSDPFIQQLVQNINKPLSTPGISGMSTPQVPTSLQTPIQNFQPAPLMDKQVVGKHNAKIQGIGNAIIGATNAVGAVVTAEAQQKQMKVKDAATNLIMAQQGKDEAKAANEAALENLKNATPGSPEAEKFQQEVKATQAELDKNDDVIKKTFADPKIAKSLAKGFDISYVDPASNNSPDHKAVMDAIKQAKTLQEKKQILQQAREKAASQTAEQFGKSQPRGIQQNPFEAQQRQAELQNREASQQALKTYLDYKSKQEEHETQLEKSYIERGTELKKQENQIKNQDNLRRQSFEQRKEVLSMENRNATNRLYLEANLAVRKDRAVLDMQNADPDFVKREALRSAGEWSSREETAQGRLDKAQSDLAALQKSPGDPMYDAAEKIVEQAQDDLDMVQDKSDYALDSYNTKLAQLGVEPIPGPKAPEDKSKTGDKNGTGSSTNTTPKLPPGNNFTDFLGTPASPPVL